jgi:hypothetical protein
MRSRDFYGNNTNSTATECFLSGEQTHIHRSINGGNARPHDSLVVVIRVEEKEKEKECERERERGKG